MSTGKKYGLIITKKATNKKELISKPSVFGDDDEDDDPDALIKAIRKVGTGSSLNRKTKLEIDAALEENPNVYEYDAVYDQMQEERRAKFAGPEQPKEKDKKPKYINQLLKTASHRKREHERRVERQVQREREEEKDEYEDTESFVTGAYRQKMAEMVAEEEEERRKEMMEAQLDVTKQKDLSGFYRNLLRQTTGPGEVKSEVSTGPGLGQPEVKSEVSTGPGLGQPEVKSQVSSGSGQPEVKSEVSTGSGSGQPEVKFEVKQETQQNRASSERVHPEDRDATSSSDSSDSSERRHDSRTSIAESGAPERRASRERHSSREREHRRHRSRSKDGGPQRGHRSRDRHPDDRASDNTRDTPTKPHREPNPEGKRDRSRSREDKQREDNSVPDVRTAEAKMSKDSKDTSSVDRMVKFSKRNVGESVEDARTRYLARKQGRVVAIARDPEAD